MNRLLTVLTSLIAVGSLAACCNLPFGNMPAAPPPPVAPPPAPVAAKKPNDKPKPPPDPAAVAIEEAKGRVVYDDNLPDRPVVEVYAPFAKGTDADFKKLASFKKLRKLYIAQNSGNFASSITGAGFKDIAHLQELEYLRASFCPLTDEGISHIVGFRKLNVLYLGDAKFTDAGMKQLGTLEKLEVFTMYGVRRNGPNKNEPRDETMQVIGNFKNLRELDIAYTDAGDLTAKAIARLPLKKLTAYNTPIGDKGMAELAKLKLEELHIGGSNMGDKGLEAFAGQTQMKSLQFAYASGVTDKSVKTLSSLTGLTYLSLFMTSITKQGQEDLKKALPKCRVVR